MRCDATLSQTCLIDFARAHAGADVPADHFGAKEPYIYRTVRALSRLLFTSFNLFPHPHPHLH